MASETTQGAGGTGVAADTATRAASRNAGRTRPDQASPQRQVIGDGLEISWWVVTSNRVNLAEALGPYLATPVPMPEATRQAWAANGLRVVAVPLDQLQQVQELLPKTGAIQSQWLGQVPTWTEAIRGQGWQGQRAVALDTGRLTLGPGRLALLVRCWLVPVEREAIASPLAANADEEAGAGVAAASTTDQVRPRGGGGPGGVGLAAALRIEIILQHLDARPRRWDDNPLESPRGSLDPEQAGLLFHRLAATMTVPEGHAYLILPERPGVDWLAEPGELDQVEAIGDAESAAANPEPDEVPIGTVTRNDPVTREPALPRPRPTSRDADSIGPPSARPTTLGELLLTAARASSATDAAGDGFGEGSAERSWPADLGAGENRVRPVPRASRAILVLIPRVPEKYKLTP